MKEAFNWAAKVPERPFTLMNEFNRIAGNPEYGGYRFGRGARIAERAAMGVGLLTMMLGTGAAMAAILPGAAVTSGGIVLGLCVVKVGATAVGALTEGVVKIGNALLNKKVGVGPSGPTPPSP